MFLRFCLKVKEMMRKDKRIRRFFVGRNGKIGKVIN